MEATGVQKFVVETILNGETKCARFPFKPTVNLEFVKIELRTMYGVTGGTLSFDAHNADIVVELEANGHYYFIDFTPLPGQGATAATALGAFGCNIVHMQSQTLRRVIFPISYVEFQNRCASAFSVELSRYGRQFKTYKLPPAISNISDRQQITEGNYGQLCEEMRDVTLPLPAVYIWSCAEDGNSPNQFAYEGAIGLKSYSIRGSTSVSHTIRSTYDYYCLACNADCTNAKGTLEGCHILEFEELAGLGNDEIKELAKSCGIDSINDHRNIIPLCSTCHNYFDRQELGIALDGTEYTWQMKSDLEEVQMPHSEKLYGTLRGTEIVFRKFTPPPKLIAHRQKRFIGGISSKRKKRKADELDKVKFEDFADQLRNINCSEETISELWNEVNGNVSNVTKKRKKPNKNSDWEQIEPPSARHGESSTFWYNATLGRFWIKLKGG